MIIHHIRVTIDAWGPDRSILAAPFFTPKL